MRMKKAQQLVITVYGRIATDICQYKIAILFFLLYNIVVRVIFHAFCPSLIVYGVPCAGCGMTRAVYYILTGSVSRGMALNPAAPLWIILISYLLINRYILGRKGKLLYPMLIVVCIVTMGIYIYRMMYEFPGDPPMVRYKNSILANFVHFFRGLLQIIRNL